MIATKWGMSNVTVGSSFLHCEAYNPCTNYSFVSRKIRALLGLHNQNLETSNAFRVGGSPTFGALQIEEREIFRAIRKWWKTKNGVCGGTGKFKSACTTSFKWNPKTAYMYNSLPLSDSVLFEEHTALPKKSMRSDRGQGILDSASHTLSDESNMWAQLFVKCYVCTGSAGSSNDALLWDFLNRCH